MRRVLFIVVVLLWAPSCATTRLPAALSQEQAGGIVGLHYDCSVGVERYAPSVYSDALCQTLSATGMFKHVEMRDEAKSYDVVARVTEPVYGSATIPVIAIVTVGIIPSIIPERTGLRFSLANVATGSSMMIDATYTSDTYLGWIALPMMLFPGYSCGDAKSSQRYRDFLCCRIANRPEQVLMRFRQ